MTLRSDLKRSELVELLGDHFQSLPYRRGTGPLLWLGTFVAAPAAATIGLWLGPGFDLTGAATAGLLSGVGILGGLLFQVLAWVSGRLGTLADQIVDRPPTPAEMSLIGRLDIARANIAYSSFLSIAIVAQLGSAALIASQHAWLNAVSAFALFHLCLTLFLMLFRINRIGKSDRVDALTAFAREQRRETVGS